ncbi:hypothetical protein [Shimia sp.]|uniref:hypothetical protein n=1 Tax=Shimia sp. TaxID=1954381 RepID=UPI0035648CF8
MAAGFGDGSRLGLCGLAAVGALALAGAAQADPGRVVLHEQPTRLISLETANTAHEGTVALTVGSSQTDPRSAAGTGNQLYFGGASYAPGDRLTLGLDLQNYVDLVGGPIAGSTPHVELTTAALWGKYRLYSDSRISIAAQASLESFVLLDSTLFGGASSNVMIGSLKAPISYAVSPELQLHLTPSVSVLPDTVNGTGFYGTIASVGVGASYKPSDRLSFFGAVDVPVSGTNTIASSGAYEAVPVWTLGGRFNITPKGAIEAYVTNGIGMTPATSALTFWPGGDRVLAGLQLVYTPGAKRPDTYRGVPAPVTLRQARLQQDGFTLGTADVLEPGRARVSGWYGTDNQAGVLLAFSPDRDGEIQLVFEQFSDSTSAPAALVPRTDVRYMIGPKIRFLDQNNGDAFSLSGRMLYGRSIGSRMLGVFFAEALASYKAAGGAVVTLNPKLAAFGSTEIAGLGLGLNYALRDGLELIAEVTPVALDASTPTWAAGLRYHIGNSGLSLDAQASNAIGSFGIGGMVAQNDPRITVTLSKLFGG